MLMDMRMMRIIIISYSRNSHSSFAVFASILKLAL